MRALLGYDALTKIDHASIRRKIISITSAKKVKPDGALPLVCSAIEIRLLLSVKRKQSND